MANIYGIPDSTISQGFGNSQFNYRPYGITRNNGYFHDGDDLAGPAGSPIPAKEGGSVMHLKEMDARGNLTGFGNYAVFTSDSGYVVIYAHLSRFGKSGRVNAGDVIGYRGTTGNSTGNHTHVTVYPPNRDYNNGVKGAIPPIEYFKRGANLPYSDEQYKAQEGANSDNASWGLGLMWQVLHGRPADAGDIRVWQGTAMQRGGLDSIWKQLTDPDNPASDEHRNAIKKVFKLYFGPDRVISDKEIRERTPQTLPQLHMEFAGSEEHRRYLGGLNDGQTKALQEKIDKARAALQ